MRTRGGLAALIHKRKLISLMNDFGGWRLLVALGGKSERVAHPTHSPSRVALRAFFAGKGPLDLCIGGSSLPPHKGERDDFTASAGLDPRT